MRYRGNCPTGKKATLKSCYLRTPKDINSVPENDCVIISSTCFCGTCFNNDSIEEIWQSLRQSSRLSTLKFHSSRTIVERVTQVFHPRFEKHWDKLVQLEIVGVEIRKKTGWFLTRSLSYNKQ